MSRPHSAPRPDDFSMSGALPVDSRPASRVEAQMLGPAGYDSPQTTRPPPSPYTGTDPFRPQRTSDLPPQELAAPGPPMTPMLSTSGPDLRSARSTSHAAVGQLVELVKRRQGAPPASTISADVDAKIRAQGQVVLDDLRMLRGELKAAARGREGHRWRRWIVGGAAAAFIPGVRTLFRRFVPPSSDVTHASNDTEYAFARSKSLLARIRASVLGRGGVLAGLALFVFAVLSVFQNEVALRVARTLSKRVKKLAGKVERGGYEVDEADLKALEGWRWRVLLW